MTVHGEKLLENVEHTRHLCEDEHAMLTGLQLNEKLVEGLEFATVELDETSIGELGRELEVDFREEIKFRFQLGVQPRLK